MFVANQTDKEKILESWLKIVGEHTLALLKKGKGYQFYDIVFRHIKEEDFRCLYSDKWSCPNSPVNQLVSAIVLCVQRDWSNEELERQLAFNIEIRIALGLSDIASRPFTIRTLYNFQNRLLTYERSTGINLLKQLFEQLTDKQLKALELDTSIQRIDSVLLESNIKNYSRISLLVEVLRRLYLLLCPADQQAYYFMFKPYLKGGEKFAYELKPSDKEGQLATLGQVYYSLYKQLGDSYKDQVVYQTFVRAYQDHFEVCEQTQDQDQDQDPATVQDPTADSIEVKVRQGNLGSAILQSPDDLDATFRKKRKEFHHGSVAFGTETCHPNNELNLVTTIDAATNNTDDAAYLEDNLANMVERTPKLKELHTDGGFGSTEVDKIAATTGVTIIQTAVKGRTAQVPIAVQGDEEQGFLVNCPQEEQPSVKATKTPKRYKASFDLNICNTCPFREECPAFKHQSVKKNLATFYFPVETAARQKRHQAVQKLPKERQTLRSGVEGLMGQMHRGAKHTGKLKVRGLLRTKLYVFAMGITINFERIYNWLFDKKANNSIFSLFSPSPLSPSTSVLYKIIAQNNYVMSMNFFG